MSGWLFKGLKLGGSMTAGCTLLVGSIVISIRSCTFGFDVDIDRREDEPEVIIEEAKEEPQALPEAYSPPLLDFTPSR